MWKEAGPTSNDLHFRSAHIVKMRLGETPQILEMSGDFALEKSPKTLPMICGILVMWVMSNPVQSSHLRAVKPCETSTLLEARFSTPFFKHWFVPQVARCWCFTASQSNDRWISQSMKTQEVNKVFMWFGSMGISQLSEPWSALVAVVASYLMYLPPCPLLFSSQL